MMVPTKNDWSKLAKDTESWIEDAVAELGIDISAIDCEFRKLQKVIDWDWEVYTDADCQPKAVYWDNATEEEREMLDYFAKFEYAKREVIKKLKQALNLTFECTGIMHEITNLEKSK